MRKLEITSNTSDPVKANMKFSMKNTEKNILHAVNKLVTTAVIDALAVVAPPLKVKKNISQNQNL